MSALALIDGVLPWVSESARNDLMKARAEIAELADAATQASATLGHAYHTTLTGRLAEHAHADYQRLDAALTVLGAA